MYTYSSFVSRGLLGFRVLGGCRVYQGEVLASSPTRIGAECEQAEQKPLDTAFTLFRV